MKAPGSIGITMLLLACSLFVSVFAATNDFPGKGSLEDWKRSQIEYELAHKFKESGNMLAAVDHFKKAIGIYPYDDKYYSSRADCFRKLGEQLNAKNDCSKAIVLKNEPVYWIMIADISADQGDFLTCKKAANTAIAAGDSSVTSLANSLMQKWTRMAAAKGTSLPNTTAKMAAADLGVGMPAPASSYLPPPIESVRAPQRAKDHFPFDKESAHFLTPPRRIIGRPAENSPEANQYIPPFLDKNRSR